MFSRVILSAALVVSGTVSAVAAEGDKWTPYVDVEGKLGTDRNLGEVGVFVPLGQSQDSLLFGNLITRFDDQDSFEGNVGLGYREIVDGSYILGGYAFFDRRKSASDNYFNQVMAGAEFMTDVWSARANAYFADNDLAPTGGGVVTQTGTQIFVQSNLEGALSGFDAEVGRVIPLGLDDVTLTGFAGGFHFGRSGFEDVSGPRGRAELSFNNLWDTMLPSGTQLRFGAEVQHDDVRDTQGFLSARLRVPLFGSSSSSNLSVLDQRMVDPVVRDIDVVAGGTLSVPVTPVFQDTGAAVRGATIIDADDDLGVALTAAGPDAFVVIDGSKGLITSAAQADAELGQRIVGAQSAQFSLRDPTTGSVIPWAPVPNGTRPTLQSVELRLPGANTLSAIDMNGSMLVAGPLSGMVPAVPREGSDYVVSDVAFTGAYDFRRSGVSSIITISGTRVNLNSLSFLDIATMTTQPVGASGVSTTAAIHVVFAGDVEISNVTAERIAVADNSFAPSLALVALDVAGNVTISNFNANGASLTATGPGGMAPPSSPQSVATVTGVSVSRGSHVSIQNSSFRNLTATFANGPANATGVLVSSETSPQATNNSVVTLDNVSLSGFTEAGTNIASTSGVQVGPFGRLFASGPIAQDITLRSVGFSGVTQSIEFESGRNPVTVALTGSGNIRGMGVGACLNSSPATLTVTGSVSFTDGTTCP